MPVGPRMPSVWAAVPRVPSPGAVCAGAPAATSRRSNRIVERMCLRPPPRKLDFYDLAGALLEIGLERDRVRGVKRHLIDELARVEPWDEHETARRHVAPPRLD